MSILDQIEMYKLPDNQYYPEETQKKVIVVHHTAGNSNPYGVIDDWAATPERVATHFVIAGTPSPTNTKYTDGKILQTYSTKFWGHHLGLTQDELAQGGPNNTILNQQAIAIEICNWGPLTLASDGTYRSYCNIAVPANQVVQLSAPYKGYTYYHAYTDAQLNSLQQLLQFLCSKWNIPTAYKGDSMFAVSHNALMGEGGIWTHTSYRNDKSDCSPQPKLIQVLSSLE